MDGFLIVNKPKGLSSFSVCNKIKKKLNINKCGHNGTLDENASGVMIVAVNKATKLIKLLEIFDKAYIAKIVFGYNSTTLDVCGEIIEDIDMEFGMDELNNSLLEVSQMNYQIPPLTSAIKINGHKLWWYQKNKIDIELPKRNVKILDYKVVNPLTKVLNHFEIDIYLHVDKGYFIRSFARDLGESLGGCAIVKELTRVKNGSFKIDKAKNIDDINENDIISIYDMFNHLDCLEVNDYIAKLVKNGITLDDRQIITTKPFFVKNNDNIIAIYECVDKYQYKPLIIF